MRVGIVVTVLLATIGGAYAKQDARVGNSRVLHSASVQHRSHMDGVKHVRKRHKRLRYKTRRAPPGALPAGSENLATVPTAAGISITVAKNLADPFRGFIEELVRDGYTPKHIRCWAPVGTHVPNSNHYHGGACDFDQTGRNRTASKMYHVRSVAERWGLRDGCTFRDPDCGHIDDGRNVGWRFKHPNLIARYIDWKNTPIPRSKIDLTPFEE